MTIDRITSAATALTSLASSAQGAGQVATAGARSIALEVAGRLAGEFLRSPDASQPPQRYEIGRLADALGEAILATALETVELENAMQDLAGAIAADLTAFADGRTLDRLDAAVGEIADHDAPATPANVIQSIERIAAAVAAAR